MVWKSFPSSVQAYCGPVPVTRPVPDRILSTRGKVMGIPGQSDDDRGSVKLEIQPKNLERQ